MCFNQTGDISTQNDSCLKKIDKFTYLGRSVSSTATDIDTQVAKACATIKDYRSYGSQTWPIIEMQFLQSSGRVDTAVRMHDIDANETDGEKA